VTGGGDRVRRVATGLAARARQSTAVAAARRFAADNMTERAAALAFYALFSLIPVLLIAAAAIRLFGDAETAASAERTAADAGAASSVSAVLRDMLDAALRSSPEGTGSAGLAGIVTLLYGASKAFTDGGRALDRIGGIHQARRPLRKRAADLGWTVVLVLFGLLEAGLVVLTGGLLRALLDALGLEGGSRWLWELARWPVLASIALVAVAIVRWAGPTATRPPFRVLTPGNVVCVGLVLVASAGYSVYLSTLASYNATYGVFAALIILMLWVWGACLAFLYGAELDAVLDERAAGQRGPLRAREAVDGEGDEQRDHQLADDP
jgi:membrane protein